MTQYSVEPFSKTTTVGSVGENGDVNVTVSATRQVHIESTIISGSGMVNNVVWVQNLQYNNVHNFLSNTTIQVGEIHYILQSILFDFIFMFIYRTYVKLHPGQCHQHITVLLLSLIILLSRSPSMRPFRMVEISVGLNSLLQKMSFIINYCVSPSCYRSLIQS